MEKVKKLLELELKNFDDLTGRILDLSFTSDDMDGLMIQVRVKDFSSFKIVASSIMRYIEIIGKVMELIQDFKD
jgi:tRNA threonylcarbamoyladenosine modification (KEOPS) complex  Pcc1 subunit